MKLLAIDTALEACSVAVAAGDDEPLVISEDREGNKTHAERLFGMIEAAMAEAGLAFADLDRIAVTVGPGSFTGLRVGIAAARGLALVVKCPVVGLGTLAVHAEAARAVAGPVPVLALLDARRDEFYGERFAAVGTSAGAAEVGSAAHFAALVMEGDVLAGSGADQVAAVLPKRITAPVVHRASAPDMHALLRLALRAPVSGAPPRPLYLRPPDAKPQVDKRIATKRREAPSGASGKQDKRRGAPSGASGKQDKRRGAPSGATGKQDKRRGAPSGASGKKDKRRGRPEAGPGTQT
jgi:tRNA threonylcarbamoyl adenosine modification protein YeaZ